MAAKAERVAALERDLFMKDEYTDPRSRRRIVPMQVLNMSFPRTSSMCKSSACFYHIRPAFLQSFPLRLTILRLAIQAALNRLGYSCYHSMCFFSSIRDTNMWDEALDAKFSGIGKPFTLEDWDKLLGLHSAVSTDPPASGFAEELIALYPDAKVILIEREIESWFTTFDNAIFNSMWGPLINFVADLGSRFVGRLRSSHYRWARGYMHTSNAEEKRRNARDVYKAHYDLVRRVTPKVRSLEYEMGSGWGPLCDFPRKDAPPTAFPHVNDTKALNEMIMLVAKKAVMNFVKKMAKYVLPIAIVIFGLYLIRIDKTLRF